MSITTLIQASPKTSIIIFSFLVTLFTTLVTYFVVDRKAMAELKEKQKILKEDMKKHKDNPDKMMELNKQMMEHLPEQMKHSFKPVLITLVPLGIFFMWLRGVFVLTTIANSWIWYYIGSSFVFSFILRKVFKLD